MKQLFCLLTCQLQDVLTKIGSYEGMEAEKSVFPILEDPKYQIQSSQDPN